MDKISMFNQEVQTMDKAFELFIRKCKVKNLSDITIESYRKKIKPFFEFYNNGDISDITAAVIDDYTLWVKDKFNCNDISVNGYLRHLRAFLYYCMECGYIKPFKIKMIKAEKKTKETYTEQELEMLLKKPDIKKCSFTEYKTWVFENYLIATGNRISSAINLKIKDIDFDENIIYIRKTKNRKQQIIPLSQTLAEVLTEFLCFRGGNGDDYLFCDEYGNQSTVNNYRQLVRRYNIRHNVNKTSCHTFRHTFAKNWILAGGDVFRLQKILGHSDLTVTREYVNMFGTDLQLDFEKFNPLDRLNRRSQERIRL